jgi:hypothetical protein
VLYNFAYIYYEKILSILRKIRILRKRYYAFFSQAGPGLARWQAGKPGKQALRASWQARQIIKSEPMGPKILG